MNTARPLTSLLFSLALLPALSACSSSPSSAAASVAVESTQPSTMYLDVRAPGDSAVPEGAECSDFTIKGGTTVQIADGSGTILSAGQLDAGIRRHEGSTEGSGWYCEFTTTLPAPAKGVDVFQVQVGDRDPVTFDRRTTDTSQGVLITFTR